MEVRIIPVIIKMARNLYKTSMGNVVHSYYMVLYVNQ